MMSGSLAGDCGTFDQRAEGTDGKDPDQLPAMSGYLDASCLGHASVIQKSQGYPRWAPEKPVINDVKWAL